MKNFINIWIIFGISGFLYGQNIASDTLKTIKLNEVIITANRMPITLKNNPGAVSLVTYKTLSLMPKGIGAEEALRLVPGIRIDNQHDGERVHISIRGQGILTERGLRGIGVLLDGIPVNDPSGFAPDLYDVDWATVQKIEVLRGPSAGLYGSSGAAGILNITTRNGGTKPVGGTLSQTIGSNGFFKTLVGVNGTKDFLNYRMGYSRTDGSGYRDHQAFWGNNLYEKMIIKPSQKLSVTQIISHTDYFQQNPEGLNLSQLDNPRQANPDARPFNEYQKTNRTTAGFTGSYKFNKVHSIRAYSFYRTWNYKETSNRYAEYRDYTDPGAGILYNLDITTGKIEHHFSAGTDLKWQTINMYKLKSAANPDRVESIDETNIETDTLLANQIISQHSAGLFVLYRLELGKFNILGNMRYDNIKNQLTDKMLGIDTAKTSMNFSETSFRLGANYKLTEYIRLFVNWSQGFMPPSTEELASNPVGYSGFNTHLIPATSNCIETGSRGTLGKQISYDITGFIMHTRNDFFRFKQSGRGNQEVFYGNAGNSRRFGIETWLSFDILKNLNLQLAYTYANYKYTSATIDPVYTDTTYVLTIPPAPGQYLPNSPKHQLYAEAIYSINKHFKMSLGTEIQSKWAIYTDAKAYSGKLDPAIYRNWQKGFNLYHTRIVYLWELHGIQGEFSLAVRNFTGEKYMAFTEPDPDGNAYQPGPGQEFFGNIKISF
ncbi:MAG: TonB-dependent receptor [Bacteroidales bacterium]|nr:TonB-dependent receptor [Bacteroidales bacterium]